MDDRFVYFSLFTYLFNDLLIPEWINGYLFYTLGYNTIKFYFVAQIVPCFGHWEPFHLVPVSLQPIHFLYFMIASLVAQMVKNLPAMWETQAPSLDWEDPLEKGMTTHSYSWLENSMDRQLWQAKAHGVTKTRTRLSDQHFHFHPRPTFNQISKKAWLLLM